MFIVTLFIIVRHGTTVLLKERLESRWHPRWRSWQRTCLPMQELWVRSLSWKVPLEQGMANHSIIIPWKIPWTEEPDELQSMGSQKSQTWQSTHLILSLEWFSQNWMAHTGLHGCLKRKCSELDKIPLLWKTKCTSRMRLCSRIRG